ncbi:uncharacterized protein LOC134445107 [Engraulis encrasicolus]|uniref:uncharacterized protein LOC134445107 n=1 Tax=Engraulis encrasicolus TaxID=184585 RepID=UPI002FD224E8
MKRRSKRRKVQQVRFRQTTLEESVFLFRHEKQTHDDQHCGVESVEAIPSSSEAGPSGECRAQPSRACKKVCQVDLSSSDDSDTDDQWDNQDLWSPTRTAPGPVSDSESDCFSDEAGEIRPITPSNLDPDGMEELEETERRTEPQVPSKRGRQMTRGRTAGAKRGRAPSRSVSSTTLEEWQREDWRPRDIPFSATPGPREPRWPEHKGSVTTSYGVDVGLDFKRQEQEQEPELEQEQKLFTLCTKV